MYKYDVSKTHCSPSIDQKGKFKTCYSTKSLQKIASELKKNNLKIDIEKKNKKTIVGFNSKTI